MLAQGLYVVHYIVLHNRNHPEVMHEYGPIGVARTPGVDVGDGKRYVVLQCIHLEGEESAIRIVQKSAQRVIDGMLSGS